MYEVIEYEGDVQVPNQYFWRSGFDSIVQAECVAKAVYHRNKGMYDNNYHVLVQRVGDDEGEALLGYGDGRMLVGSGLATFLEGIEK